MKIKINQDKVRELVSWLEANVGPKSKIVGKIIYGEGWQVWVTGYGPDDGKYVQWKAEIDDVNVDDKTKMVFALKWG